MSNPRFSLNDCSAIQRRVRIAADARDGVSVDRAYDIANRTLEKLFHERHPSPPPAKPKEGKLAPLPGLGAPPCTVHQEKQFTFSTGEVKRCCSHHECRWGLLSDAGKEITKHSDGVLGETIYSIEIPDAVEVEEGESEVGPEELSVEMWAASEPTMTEDGDDIENQLGLGEDEDEPTGEPEWYQELAYDER